MLESLQEIHESDWKPISTAAFAAACVGLGVFFLMLLTDDDHWLQLVDGPDLVFHEAGHPIFGILGETLGLWGGTLGQLTVPLLVLGSFWTRREAIGVAVAGAWLGQNFLNIARYMADARAQELPLVGGGEHDWFHIFISWNVLGWDTRIAAVTRALGWLVMLAAWAWLAWRFAAGRAPEAA